MNKLIFSYKKFNTVPIEHFSNPITPMTQIKQQLREKLDVDIFQFSLINPGHTFRELSVILNKDNLPWFGNSEYVYSHAHSYLKDGYLSADSILKFNETIDPILGEKITVNQGYFSNKDIKIIFPWSSGKVGDIKQSGSQVGNQTNHTGIHCYVVRPAPGEGATGEFVNYDVDHPIEDFIIFVDYSSRMKPPLIKSGNNIAFDNQDEVKSNININDMKSGAPPLKPIKPFVDRMFKCLKQYKYEFIISVEKSIGTNRPLKLKNFKVNNRRVTSSEVTLNQEIVTRDRNGNNLNTEIGNPTTFVTFEQGSDLVGKTLFTITTDGKVDSFSMTFGRNADTPGLNILENNITSINETENRGGGGSQLELFYEISQINDYPEDLAPAQLEYYVSKHGYLFTDETDTWPEKLDKGREHWSREGRENKLSWSPLFEPCDSSKLVPHKTQYLAQDGEVYDTKPPPGPSSKVYFGNLSDKEKNYIKIQHGTDPNFDTDPEALTEGTKSKCMVSIDFQETGDGMSLDSLRNKFPNHYILQNTSGSRLIQNLIGKGFFDHAQYAGLAGTESQNPTQDDCNKAKLFWKNLVKPLKVTTEFKPSGINKGNLIEDIISSNPIDYDKELSNNQKERIAKMRENIIDNNTLALKAFESLARRDQQANEHYEIVEKTTAIQLREIDNKQKKIDSKYKANKKGLDKIATDSRNVVVDQEKEAGRRQVQNIFIWTMIILSALILISISFSKD